MNLKETCQNADAEYEERVKSRQEEIKACGEALAILTSDEAHATFSSTFSFAQASATSKSQKAARDSASKVLSEAAKNLHSPRLSALASRVRLDAFTKVKAAIDEMIGHGTVYTGSRLADPRRQVLEGCPPYYRNDRNV